MKSLLLILVGISIAISPSRAAEPRQWICSYVCYVDGKADSVGCRIVTANNAESARIRFRKEMSGETCRITNIEKAPNNRRSFYDSKNPQPKAFYDWMDKVSTIASSKDINIDGDEDYFIGYWKKGYAPKIAVKHFQADPWPNMGGGE